VVVAEKQVVYEKFPIPLINRLEKHFLAMATMLTEDQMHVVDKLSEWAKLFANVSTRTTMHRYNMNKLIHCIQCMNVHRGIMV
jgi:hypothetical protein